MKFSCPHCQAPVFGLKDKLMAGKWLNLTCPRCGGRSCDQPILLALLYFALVWNFLLFGYLAVIEHQLHDDTMTAVYVVVTVVGWLALEALGLLIPLARMRPAPAKGGDENTAGR